MPPMTDRAKDAHRRSLRSQRDRSRWEIQRGAGPARGCSVSIVNALTGIILAMVLAAMAGFLLAVLNPDILPAPLRPIALPSAVVLPTSDPGVVPPTAPPSDTPLPTFAPSTETAPLVAPTNNPGIPDAIVKPESGGLRLREAPDTDAPILAHLDPLTALDVIGRTEEGAWVQVVGPQGSLGWVTSEHLQFSINVAQMPVTFATLTPTPTPTPVRPTETATPSEGAGAQVKADGGGLNLRASPGTAAPILTTLAALTPLTVVGRTENNAWLEVVTPVGNHGWVLARFVDVYVELSGVSVTGLAVDLATATPTASPTRSLTPRPATLTALAQTPSPAPTSTPYAAHPYLSVYLSNARQIFLGGRRLGNRASVFSKVGDSITAGPESSFLSQIGLGDYDLAGYSSLQPVVDYFSQQAARENNLAWNNTSLAAANGWGSTEVLSPEAADHSLCPAGESPLACEYRLVRPSVSLIMIGTNDAGGIPLEIYRANLRQIVEYSIQRGVIPVLFTIPPRNYDPQTDGRVPDFNAAIRQTADDYQVPLIDYWRPMISAPNLGLKDGVHPSEPPGGQNAHLTAANMQYGSTLRNLLALQMLDVLWRQVIGN